VSFGGVRLLFFPLTIGLAACGGSGANSSRTEAAPPAAAPGSDLVPRGEGLYRAHRCGSCHDTTGPASKPLVGLKARFSESSLAQYFLEPRPPMPAYPLDDDQRRALAAYTLLKYP
jgi:mono/diheme cytochrome c family protein